VTDRLEEIKARAAGVPDGPWGWRGYSDGSIELRTLRSGGLRLISTMRGEPCIVALSDESIALAFGACSACRSYYAGLGQDRKAACKKQENLNTIWLWDDGYISPANKWAVNEQTYRTDVARVDHPGAEFFAHSREDIDWLVAEVERLRSTAITVKCWSGLGCCEPSPEDV